MVGRRDEETSGSMIEVQYRQDSGEREVTAVLQKLYVCASVEFLMAVAEFFLQAVPQSSAPAAAVATSDRLPLRQTAEPRSDTKTGQSWTLAAAWSVQSTSVILWIYTLHRSPAEDPCAGGGGRP